MRRGHVTVLGGTFIHAVLSLRRFCIFFHPVHFGVGHHTGNRHCMTDMLAEIEGVALDLPSAAFRRSKLVLIGVHLFKATPERPYFLMSGFRCVLCRSRSG